MTKSIYFITSARTDEAYKYIYDPKEISLYSPFMFLANNPDNCVFVEVTNEKINVNLIAGTNPKGPDKLGELYHQLENGKYLIDTVDGKIISNLTTKTIFCSFSIFPPDVKLTNNALFVISRHPDHYNELFRLYTGNGLQTLIFSVGWINTFIRGVENHAPTDFGTKILLDTISTTFSMQPWTAYGQFSNVTQSLKPQPMQHLSAKCLETFNNEYEKIIRRERKKAEKNKESGIIVYDGKKIYIPVSSIIKNKELPDVDCIVTNDIKISPAIIDSMEIVKGNLMIYLVIGSNRSDFYRMKDILSETLGKELFTKCIVEFLDDDPEEMYGLGRSYDDL